MKTSMVYRFALATLSLLMLSGCGDTIAPVTDGSASPTGPPTTAPFAFACTGSESTGVRCTPASASTSIAASFDKIVGKPFAALTQTAFDYGASGPNQLRATIALQNRTVQPFATAADYVTYNSVGAKVFFFSGPTNTGGTAGAVTLVNPDGTGGTFTATNQSFFTYAEQLPANATTLTPKQWIFQLPDATTTFSFQVYVDVALPDESTSITVPAHTFASIAPGIGGFATCGIRTGGIGYCWGANGGGQLGDGTTTERHVPVGILGVARNLTKIVYGSGSPCALTSSGQIYCWGDNRSGQGGTSINVGSTNLTPQPVTVPTGVTSFTDVAASGSHACAVANTSQVYCWGSNVSGELGTASNVTPNATPLLIPLPSGVTGFTAVAAGNTGAAGYSCAIANTGQVYCWGDNNYGQLGTATRMPPASPHSTPTLQAVPFPTGVIGFGAIATGGGQTCGIANSGAAVGHVFCWGYNIYGELGTSVTAGTSTGTPVAQEVPLPSGVTSFGSVATGELHTCAIANTGQIYCWGYNYIGQLGTDTNKATFNATPTPQAVPLPSGVASFTSVGLGGLHTCAVANTGQAYCWGYDVNGVYGNGTTGNGGSALTAVSMP